MYYVDWKKSGKPRKRDMKKAFRKYQESGKDQRVTRHTLGRARAQIT